MKKINEYLPYFVLVSVIMIDCIIFYSLMKVMDVFEKELIAALIGFVGSVLGGVITLIGVNATLKHRDRELFLNNATERLVALEQLIESLNGYSNSLFFYNTSEMDGTLKCRHVKRETKAFYEKLNSHKEMLYKNLEFDEIQIINFYQKTLTPLILKETLEEEEKEKCIEKVQSIFKVLIESKGNLEKKYYKYKKESKHF
ncbi:hypothetical protein Q8G31_23915 [Priestia megaterium]|uniref:hypothetical protein n=1 Tax=Priestia megaterium TaxID=1404 RepID=UPI00272F485A|nr:hypothetical protein [Priestia megaterium]MDP1383029.1 hypothetical protein [Priestia megaterium]MDP1426925.1 hypothetical protein [Priestia megaterium]